jgi:hypothetical protein
MTFQHRTGRAWTWASGIVSAGLLGSVGCGDAFSSNCAKGRTCAHHGQGEAGAGAEPSEAAAGGSSAAAGGGPAEAGATAAAAAGEPSGPGNTPPSVLSITPADGTEDVDLDTTISVVFSEPLAPESVVSDRFRLFDGELEIAGTVVLSETGERLDFKPEQPLDLWVQYRAEISHELSDVEGATMESDYSSSFRARDGAWAVVKLADGPSVELPPTLPVSSTGSLLPTWIVATTQQCSAAGAWFFRGQGKPEEAFEAVIANPYCNFVSASIASDDSAVVGWASGDDEWSQSFEAGAWSATKRPTKGILNGDRTFLSSQVFAHEGQHMSLFRTSDGYGGKSAEIERGTVRGPWSPTMFPGGGNDVQAAFGADGSGLAVWNDNLTGAAAGVQALAYDGPSGLWETEATTLPGTSNVSPDGSLPSVALGPQGDKLVLWVEGSIDAQVVRSSRFVANTSWASPITLSNNASGNPLFDAPALVFDGQTFVAAWSGHLHDQPTTYTARYDMLAGAWSLDAPHLTDLGARANFTPRLGTDSHGNLMLLWALDSGTDSMTLAFRRYRSDTGSWGQIQRVTETSFRDAEFATQGKLPFAVAPNGFAGVMYRARPNKAQEVKLAQFL